MAGICKNEKKYRDATHDEYQAKLRLDSAKWTKSRAEYSRDAALLGMGLCFETMELGPAFFYCEDVAILAYEAADARIESAQDDVEIAGDVMNEAGENRAKVLEDFSNCLELYYIELYNIEH